MFICTGYIHSSLTMGAARAVNLSLLNIHSKFSFPEIKDKSSKEVEQLITSLKNNLTTDDLVNGRFTVEKLLEKIGVNNIGDSLLCESYYLIGIYHLKVRNFYDAIRYLNLCISLKEKKSEYDQRYAKAVYNLSVAYSRLGDINKFEKYALKSLEIGKSIYDESNPALLASYLSLASAFIEVKEYGKAISNSNIALTLANKNPDGTPPLILATVYHNLSVCYSRQGDFSKAKIYLDKTESIYKYSRLDQNEDYINLLNGLAIVYNALGLKAKAAEYYEKGIALAISSNSAQAFNIINSYSVFLGTNKKAEKGKKLLENALSRANAVYEADPHNYFEVLNNFAGYLREYKIDNKKSIQYYEKCLVYLNENDQEGSLKTMVYQGYSLALEEAGESAKALGVIQSLLFSYRESKSSSENFENPPFDSLKPDINTLKILKVKYNILSGIYKKNADQKAIIAASNTSELIVALLDKVRINISEEESRLILGDRYRDSYLSAIHDFNLLYIKTADPHFLQKAFEYSEKSKVAGLLTSTRELKAVQFHIPSKIGNFEMDLQREISLFNVRISEELSREKPNELLIARWKENLLETTRKRDSLILIFEKQFPDYYSIKYNTQMVDFKEIPEIVGHDGNYINYIVSDTVLYTFIVNRKNQQLLSRPIDSSFFNDIKQFRSLLSMPSPTDNAFLKFKQFQTLGYRLYKTLIDPIKSYLVSDKIIISPDNILAYLPFETILTSYDSQQNINYRDLSYLMNSYDISYTYSATFLAESVKRESNRSNKLIAFAPDYPKPIDIKSVLMSRQAGMGVLNDLPYARQEAKYVSDLTNGKLYENSDARESVFKNESGNYDIIHLAMHTLLNDKDPMRSTLIFSQLRDSLEDGYLKTYEIYGIPLKAKMVVLSSCNTGTGLLFSGEGILSLARAFIFSGSQSVVMSMWEIEDKSGTEIVKMFYKNLKEGYPKSLALKKARMDFLKNADQLRSHPYFWSTLVIYGNNSPLYYSKKLIITLVAVFVILILFIGFYFWNRRYS